MRVFIDENMPRQLVPILEAFEVSGVEMEGWKGVKNGDLMRLIAERFDVLLTADASFAAQNNLSLVKLSLVVLPTNDLTILRAGAVSVGRSITDLGRVGEPAVMRIDWKGRRTLQRTRSGSNIEPIEIEPIPPFGYR